MTPQQIEAMKQALEALELINIEFVCGNGSHHKKEDRHEWDEDCPITNRWRKAITALEEALAQPEQEPVVHDPLPRACNLAGVDYQTFLKIKAYMPVAPPQPEQEPVAWMDADGNVSDNNDHKCFPIPLYTTPPQQEPVISKWVLREVYFDEDGEPVMHRSPPQPEQIQPSADSNTHQPERHELQAKGEHPAPCARHCEANAFQIVIRNLKAQLAQPEQEEKLPPVEIGVDVTDIGTTVVAFYRRPNAVMEMFYSQFHPLAQPEQEPEAWYDKHGMVTHDPFEGVTPLYLTPPQRTEQCNYPDCKCPTENPCLKGLAQPEQEPVAIKRMKEWIEYLKRKSDFGQHMKIPSEMSAGTCWELALELEQFINTTPSQQEPVIDKSAAIRIATSLGWTPQRKPLTNEQIWDAYMKAPVDIDCHVSDLHKFARAIEAAHGIKENT